MGLRRLTYLWRRMSFSLKFAIVLAAAGLTIAVIPFVLANSEAGSQALDRAADKAGIAQNLIQGQRNSLAGFVRAVARQVSGNVGQDRSLLTSTLEQDVGVPPSGDVLGVVDDAGDVLAVRGVNELDSLDPLVTTLGIAVFEHQSTTADSSGTPWILASAPVPGSTTVAFVARPVTRAVVSAYEANLATPADPSDLVIVRRGRVAVSGSLAGHTVVAGSLLDPAIAGVLGSNAGSAVFGVNARNVALARSDLGDGFELVVTTPVGVVAIAWQSALALAGLILLAMIVIVLVVQIDLQQPLRRLDRAVAAVGRGQFDVPVPRGSEDELGRLGETFEAMRVQLQAMIGATNARAAVATELNSPQPLDTALAKVCGELRRSTEVDAVMILGSGSEMGDPFAIADGVPVQLDIESFLNSDGPLGAGYHHSGRAALLVSAAPASLEAQLGMRDYCVAPLRVGPHLLGVLALANAGRDFRPSDAELVYSAAEQMAIALERYDMMARIQRQASVDDLTGLHNHRFFVDYLAQQVAVADRVNTRLSVLMLDIDHFKVLNDTHGHQAGDTALAAFADTLRANVRRSDLAARYGGEEFAVVMANTDAAQARVVAEKIRHAVAETAVRVDASRPSLTMTVSVGGASFPEDTHDAGELLRLADEALYHSKRSGRDRVSMASDRRTPPPGALRIITTAPQHEAAVSARGSDRPQE